MNMVKVYIPGPVVTYTPVYKIYLNIMLPYVFMFH